MSVLCLQSIHKYFPDTPITIIIDNYDLKLWPDYVSQYQNYIDSEFENLDISYKLYTELPKVDDAHMGGWFRQQLIKLHVDHFVNEDSLLLVDADVILEEYPRLDNIPANPVPFGPISAGFHHYIKYMLGIDPWLGTKEQNLGSSWAPVRYVTKQLIQSLRSHVEKIHQKNFLDLHLDLMKQQKIVAYDPDCNTMIMSEYEMLEVFRRHLWTHPLPLQRGAGNFYHTSEKDWRIDRGWFESKGVNIADELWEKVQFFGTNPIYQTGNN